MDKKIYKKLHSIFKDKPKRLHSIDIIKKRVKENFSNELKQLIKNKVIIETFDKRYILNSGSIKIGTIVDYGIVSFEGENYEINNLPKGAFVVGDEIFFVIKKGYAQFINIYKRNDTVFVGKLEFMKNFAFFVPRARRIFYKDPVVEYEHLKNANDGDLVSVKVVKWPQLTLKSSRAKVKVEKIFGDMSDPKNQIMGLIRELEIKQKFHQGVKDEVNKLKEFKKGDGVRVDLTDRDVITIDPDDAKDFDDAVSVIKHKDYYEIGVHIADVSYYVKPGSKLDKEALIRGNSTYLVGRVIPMLPEKLSNDLCSLKPNVIRPAFSAQIHLDFSGNVIYSNFYESIIKSKKRFTYKEAQKVLDGKLDSDFASLLFSLKEVAELLISRTNKRGYINFKLPELDIQLDENGNTKAIAIKEELFTHRMIEEFMLLANEQVAEFITKKGVNSIYRIHDKPEVAKLNETFSYFRGFGLQFNNVSSIEPIDIQKMLNSIDDDAYRYLINDQILRTMQKAIYTPINRGHFGLALLNYTHFTSPIRRYADLVVHRVLKHILKGNSEDLYSFKELNEISEHISETERRSMTLERESVKLKTMEYMQNFIGDEFSGFITGVINSGFFVQLQTMAVEGFIPFKSLKDFELVYESDSKKFKLNGSEVYIGKRVMIRVKLVDIANRMLDFELLEILN